MSLTRGARTSTRARRRHHLPRHRVTVTHHQPTATLVTLTDVRVDVRGNLGLQRRRQHPPRTLPHDLVDRRHTRHDRGGGGRWRQAEVGNYREHGRTLPTRGGTRASA